MGTKRFTPRLGQKVQIGSGTSVWRIVDLYVKHTYPKARLENIFSGSVREVHVSELKPVAIRFGTK